MILYRQWKTKTIETLFVATNICKCEPESMKETQLLMKKAQVSQLFFVVVVYCS